MMFLPPILLLALPLPPSVLFNPLGTDLTIGLARIPGGRPRGRPLVLPLVLAVLFPPLLLLPLPPLAVPGLEFDAADRGRMADAASTSPLVAVAAFDVEIKGGRSCNRPFAAKPLPILTLGFAATRGDGDGLPSNVLVAAALRP